MEINIFFDKVFCISVPRRQNDWFNPDNGQWLKGRLQPALRHFASHDITVEVVDGVDGRDLSIPKMTSADGLPVSRGDIGCVLSHLKVARLAKQMGLKKYFVFEDDAELSHNFKQQFSQVIEQLPQEWDMLYLGGNHDGGFTLITPNIARVHRTFTTHAIGVNHTIYDHIIEVLGRQDDKVDLSISSLHARFNCYVARPHIAFQRADYSDILERHANYEHLRK